MSKDKKETKTKEIHEVKLSPPWMGYFHKLEALFAKDPEVDVLFMDDDDEICIQVAGNARKMEALAELLPEKVDFGGRTIDINVELIDLPDASKTTESLFRDAFSGNEAVTRIVNVEGVFTNPLLYVEFEKDVVQFFNDNLSDLHGNTTLLMQEIAMDIFRNRSGVCFCTDNKGSEEVGKPLGEWP